MIFKDQDELIGYATTTGAIDTQYDVIERKIGVIPFRDTTTTKFRRCVAYWEHMESIKKDKHHTTVCAYDGDQWYIWCNDGFLTGSYDTQTFSKALAVAADKQEEAEMHASFGSCTKNTGCNFHKKPEDEKSCKHTNNLCASITENIVDQIFDLYHGNSKKRISRRTPEELLQKYSFRKHIILKGDKGSGKTYLAKIHAEKHADVVVDIIGHDGIESSGLLGHLVPYAKSIPKTGQTSLFESNEETVASLVYKNGPLTKAFKSARDGKKVIIVFDEFLRVPSNQMQLLVGAISPNHKGEYVLPTENMIEGADGELHEEVVVCPKENLWIIATTNVGSAYDVSDIDSALDDRFQTIRMDSDIAAMKVILNKEATTRRYPSKVVDGLLEFYKDMNRLLIDQRLQKICNTRHLIEAIQNSIDEDDIGMTLYETREKWISDMADGQPDEIELRTVEKTISSHFGTF
jgi:MoxR-like ATPase